MRLKPIRFRNLISTCDNNRRLGQLRLYSALDWCFRWQFTTAEQIAALLTSRDRRHYRWLASWERHGLIRRTPTLSPIAREIITLTPFGVTTLQSALGNIGDDELLLRYQHDVSRINLNNLTHSIAVQMAVLLLVGANKIDRYATEHELSQISRKGVKQPDAILGNSENVHIALEVELTPKNRRLLDQAIAANLNLIRNKEATGVWYVSHLRSILDRIQNLLDSGEISVWERDNQYKWSKAGLELPRFSGQFNIWGLSPVLVPGMLPLEVDWRQIAQR